MPLIITNKPFEFDVAFSFLQEDEEIARKINELIKDRCSTFIYSDHQKELVGKDGTETFRQVFSEKARIVVVLYRESWGTTLWTRVEENAIKIRAYEESADFTLFFSLDKGKPNWLSKTQIWYDADRFGIELFIPIIEKRIVEYGGQLKEESLLDQAARYTRQIIQRKEIESHLLSKEGFAEGINEINALLKSAENNIDKISDGILNFGKNKKEKAHFTSFGRSIGLTFKWVQPYYDSLSESYLHIFIANGDYYDSNPHKRGTIYTQEKYLFYQNEMGDKGWVIKNDKSKFKSSTQIIDAWQKDFLTRNHEEIVKLNSDHSQY